MEATPCFSQNANRLNITLLLLGRLISEVGTAMFRFGLSLYILDHTKSAFLFSLILGVSVLPSLFVNMFGAIFVDKYNKKTIMVITDLLSGFAIFIFAILFNHNFSGISFLVAYITVLVTLQSLFGLAFNAAMPIMVNKDSIGKANSIIQVITSIIGIGGPIIGAIAYQCFGIVQLFCIDAISFIIAGLFEMFLVYEQNYVQGLERRNYFEDFKTVYTYLGKQVFIRYLLIFAIIINLVYVPMVGLVLPYINYHVLKVTGLQLSIIQASFAIGTIIGSLFLVAKKSTNHLVKRFFSFLQLRAFLIILWCFPNFVLFLKDSKWILTLVFSLILVVFAAISTLQITPLFTYLQLNVPGELRARFFGILNTGMLVSVPLGMWLFGIALETVKWTYIPIVSGIFIFLLAIYSERRKCFKNFLVEIEK